MAIKFTAKEEPAAAKADNRAARAATPDPKAAVAPAEEAELFPAAPKAPAKKRKARFP